MAAMKTPGVYVIEKNAFPNSVVEVDTAVPAFIGFTEMAEKDGKDLTNVPTYLTSLAQFEMYFGGPPKSGFEISLVEGESGDGSGTGGGGEGEGDKEDGGEEGGGTATESGDTFLFNKNQYLLKQTSQAYSLYYSLLLFYQNGGGPCYIVSSGNYEQEISQDSLSAGIPPLIKEQEPTMVLIPEAIRLEKANCDSLQQAVLQHCAKMKNRVAIFDIHNGNKEMSECIEPFREGIGINSLSMAAAYYPWLNTTIMQDSDLSFENIAEENISVFQGLVSQDLGLPEDPSTDTDEQKQQREVVEKMASGGGGGEGGEAADPDAIEAENDSTNKSLYSISPLYKATMAEMAKALNLLPPAAAMAGVYTMVDNSRGVWKAPANVSLNSVVSPAVDISHDEQEDLNVPVSGKAVNAIRAFVGEGVLVWGARTLDGNSLDWRYVNVRRTMIMLEESIRLATKAYVFEPNTKNTWVTVKSMIANFLNGIWKQGGLAGASPEEAYVVSVGLGETMVSEDILEGIMRITVLVAITRPAEFIEITFQQKMQES